MKLLTCLSLFLFTVNPTAAAGQDDLRAKAEEVISAAIQAMGGQKYLDVKSSHSAGRYFVFSKQGKGFAKYWDWTVYDPVKWRFQQGEGKRQSVSIYNLELGKAWTLEGQDEDAKIEEISEEQIKDWMEGVKSDLNFLLKQRFDEEGMNLYYYGPDDIAGSGQYEAVEFLDSGNKSVVVYFDRQNHLPHMVETHSTDKFGVRRKQETEFYNWHVIEGVKTPLRLDYLVEGELSQQYHLDLITYNPPIPPDHFLEPQLKKK
ncbi:MAG: hypothetical protein ACRD1R_13530 [Acidobacteriota bacterium]